MKTKYLALFLLLLTCGIGRAQLQTSPNIATIGIDYANYSLKNGKWVLVGDVTLNHVRVSSDIRYCDQLPAKDSGQDCVWRGSDNEIGRALELCAEANVRLEDEAEGYQELFEAFSPGCGHAMHWVEKIHDKYGSEWVCEKDKP